MNRKFKYGFGLVAISFLALTGCSKAIASSVASEPFNPIKDLEPLEEEVVNSLKEKIAVRNADSGVYGNIYLPEEVDGATIIWKSDDEGIINTNWDGEQAPGVVSRPGVDAEVTLTAFIKKDGKGAKVEQTVNVKGLAYELEDSDFQAYLFGHFVGEGYGKTENNQRIPTGEQMFFALADVGEGLHFKDMNGSTMNNLKPVLSSNVGEVGVRDPFICRSPEGDTFYLIATDLSVYTRGGWNNNAGQATKTGSHSITLWESHDLVNWTDARLIEVAREDAGMAWAPEMIYCEETGEYLIFFSSTILDEESAALDPAERTNAKIIRRDSVYFTTTRDFVHFGETKQFLPNIKYQDNITSRNESDQYAENNDFRKVIDASVMKIGDYYYSACKDGGNNEDGGGIRIQRTQDLYDAEWEFVQNLADVGFQAEGRNADNKCLEGPEWFYLNEDDRQDPSVPEIGLMADFYADTSIGYIPWATTDVEDINNANGSWRKLESGANKDFSWDSQTKRHGTILRITAEEAERLKEAYPIAA